MRKALPVTGKLAVTLCFLANGKSYESLQYQFRSHRTTICSVCACCLQKNKRLKDHHLRLPHTEQQWKKIASATQERWQFPNFIGAVDGKHVRILHPTSSGSELHNYKEFYGHVFFEWQKTANFDYLN